MQKVSLQVHSFRYLNTEAKHASHPKGRKGIDLVLVFWAVGDGWMGDLNCQKVKQTRYTEVSVKD